MPGFHYAGFWVRFAAFLVDAVVMLIIGVALGGLLWSILGAGNADALVVFVLLVSLAPLFVAAYGLAFCAMWSRTPGMVAFNIYVVRVDTGGRIGLSRAIVRAIGLLISLFPYGLGLLWVAFDGRKQGWHDKLAGTVVVRPT